MDKQEFLLLIPAIIYGVAIVDLLKVFRHKKNYWELLLWGIIMIIIISNTWMELYNKLGSFTDNNLNFFIIIAQAIVYAQACSILTPEEKDVDTKSYFLENSKKFFLLLAGTAIFNILVQFQVYQDDRIIFRIIGGAFFVVLAFYNKQWLRIIGLVLLYVLAFYTIFV